jgi:hypothetical protein
LESAFTKDAVSAEEYEPACQKLLSQFKTLRDALGDAVSAKNAYSNPEVCAELWADVRRYRI